MVLRFNVMQVLFIETAASDADEQVTTLSEVNNNLYCRLPLYRGTRRIVNISRAC